MIISVLILSIEKYVIIVCSSVDKAKNEIKQVMGDEETLWAGAFKVTWAPYTSIRSDSARFKKEHAELAEAYIKTTTARRSSVR